MQNEENQGLGPIFHNERIYNPDKAQQEWLASQIVEQMADDSYSSDEMGLPGNVLK